MQDLKTSLADPGELTRLRDAETRTTPSLRAHPFAYIGAHHLGLTRRVRDLEDTLQADAEFKRSLQSNIEELYKERKASKAAAEAQIAALQADLQRLQSGAGGNAGSSKASAEVEAQLNEKSAALLAARAEVRAHSCGNTVGDLRRLRNWWCIHLI